MTRKRETARIESTNRKREAALLKEIRGYAKPRPDLANFMTDFAAHLKAQPAVVFDEDKARRIRDWNEVSQQKV